MKRISLASIVMIIALCVPFYSSARKTEVSLMTFSTNQDDTKAFTKLIKEFEASHPDISVKLVPEGWGGSYYLDKIATKAAAGVSPDLILIPFYWIPNFADSGLIDELTPLIKRDKIKLSDYTQSGMDAASWKGKLWGLPTYNSSDWWITYNKKRIAEIGAADPISLYKAGKWDWASMEEIAQKGTQFTAEGKVQKMGYITFNTLEAWAAYVWGMGGELFNSDVSKCLLDDAKSIAAITYVSNLVHKKKIMGWCWAPPYNLDLVSGAGKEQFTLCAWWNTVPNHLIANRIKWPIEIIPFPRGPVSDKNNPTTIHSLALSRQSKKKNAAFKVLAFMSGKRGQTVFAEDILGLPSRHDVLTQFPRILKERRNLEGGQFVVDATLRQRPFYRNSKMELANPFILGALTKILAGSADIGTALKDAARNANPHLTKGTIKK